MGMTKEEFKKQLMIDIGKAKKAKEHELNDYVIQAVNRMTNKNNRKRRTKR